MHYFDSAFFCTNWLLLLPGNIDALAGEVFFLHRMKPAAAKGLFVFPNQAESARPGIKVATSNPRWAPPSSWLLVTLKVPSLARALAALPLSKTKLNC